MILVNHPNAARILVDFYGFVANVDFIAGDNGDGKIGIDWLSQTAMPAVAAIEAITLGQASAAAATRLAQQEKATASIMFDNGGLVAGDKLARALWAEALALLDAINIIRAAIPHPIVSITRSGTVATVTTRVAHGRVPGNPVVIAGATLAAYNIATTVGTAPTATTYTYTVAGNPATPAVGSMSWTEAEVPALLQITPEQVIAAIKAKIATSAE